MAIIRDLFYLYNENHSSLLTIDPLKQVGCYLGWQRNTDRKLNVKRISTVLYLDTVPAGAHFD